MYSKLLQADVFSINEFAAEIGFNRTRVSRWISSGLIRSFKVKNRHYIPTSELTRLRREIGAHKSN